MGGRMTPRAIVLSASADVGEVEESLVRQLTTAARLRGRLHVGWHKVLTPAGNMWLTRPLDKRPLLGEPGPPFPVRSVCALVTDDLTDAQIAALKQEAAAGQLPLVPLGSALRLIPRTLDFYRLHLSPRTVEFPEWQAPGTAPPPLARSTST